MLHCHNHGFNSPAALIVKGLCATLFLLALFRKALPALPISIALGILFYFTTQYIFVEFSDMMAFKQTFV